MQPVPQVARWFFPSIKDVLFFAYLLIPLFMGASGALYDADTGWHIRNGDQVLQTGQPPATDPFSYTHQGKPWFAWEWLADAWLACLHHWMGLNGVVLWANLTFALTFVLLFRWMLAREGHFLVALLFAVLASCASTVHWLARPHLFSMLFLLIWQMIVEQAQRLEMETPGRGKSALRLLPFLIVLWVNLHGAFVVGLVHLLIYALGNYLTGLTSSDQELSLKSRGLSWQFAKIAVVCALVSLLNPFGWQLYYHIFESYMQSNFLIDKITEFASPDFHSGVVRFFEAIVLGCLIMLAVSRERLTFIEIGLLVFWVHLSLFSVRHVPLATLVMTPIVARHFSRFLMSVPKEDGVRPWIAGSLDRLNRYSQVFFSFESQFKGYLYPSLAVILAVALCLNQGQFGGKKIIDMGFDPKRFPVKAAAFIEGKQFQGNLFTTDSWGGYIIYRFFPRHKVFFDGRSDMYDRQVIQEYEDLVNLKYSWKELLKKHSISWILLPTNYGMATALKELKEWQVVYDDETALIFLRRE